MCSSYRAAGYPPAAPTVRAGVYNTRTRHNNVCCGASGFAARPAEPFMTNRSLKPFYLVPRWKFTPHFHYLRYTYLGVMRTCIRVAGWVSSVNNIYIIWSDYYARIFAAVVYTNIIIYNIIILYYIILEVPKHLHTHIIIRVYGRLVHNIYICASFVYSNIVYCIPTYKLYCYAS